MFQKRNAIEIDINKFQLVGESINYPNSIRDMSMFCQQQYFFYLTCLKLDIASSILALIE